MKKIVALLLLTIATGSIANAQQRRDGSARKNSSIRLLARCKDGRVQLRWIPASSPVWRMGNAYGYILERMELSEAGAAKGYEPIGAVRKPLAKADWERLSGNNEFMRGAEEAVYSQPKKAEPAKGFDAALDNQNDENGIFYSYILSTNLDAEAAKASGTFYEDASVAPGKDYAYRVHLAAAPQTAGIDTVSLFISAVQNTPSPVVTRLRTEAGDGVIKLYWDFGASRDHFAAYYVERSADGGKTFEQVNRLPLIYSVRTEDEVVFTDSVKNYIPYMYRMRGLTAFGDKSSPSTALNSMGRDFTAPPAPGMLEGKGNQESIQLAWQMPYTSPDIAGFRIGRGQNVNGPFKVINEGLLPKSALTYTDKTPLSREPFYIVYAVDTAGNMAGGFAAMVNAVDTVAPATPTAFTGSVDSLGHVMLTWAHNTEEDLEGYNVFVANARDNVFRQINGMPVKAATFRDTINMTDLNRDIHYKITAVDYNNNPSPYATLLTLTRPDVIPPAAPVITSYKVSGDTVLLEWARSSSTDVIGQQLVRTDAAGKRETIRMKTADTTFADAGLAPGAYTYAVAAMDSTHSTGSAPLSVMIDRDNTEGIRALKASWKGEETAALIAWKYEGSAKDHQYILFRGRDAASLTEYRKVKASQDAYRDEDAAQGTWYYAMKVQYASGTESALSEAVRLEVPAASKQ